MNEQNKALVDFIKKTEQALDDGTIYNKAFREELNQAKQKAGIENDRESYTQSGRGHVLQD